MADDIRLTVPLYTVREAAAYVRVPRTTLGGWAYGYRVRKGGRQRIAPVVTAFAGQRGKASIPFIGLAESMVLSAFRRSGVSMQHIRRALPVLTKEVGLHHALASQRLYADGASILYDFAREGHVDEEGAAELSGLTRVLDGQRVFSDVVREYLQCITYGEDGLAVALVLPYADRELLRVRPDQAGGRPIFVNGRARLDDVLGRWRAGDRIRAIAQDFEVPPEDVEDAVRIALGAAA